MNQETTPTQPQPAPRTASAEKQALLDAYDTVLKHQSVTREAEQLEAEARRAARARVRPWAWTSTDSGAPTWGKSHSGRSIRR